MKLRSGKEYNYYRHFWWYKYTIEGCEGLKFNEKEDFSLFMYNKHSAKFWIDNILPLYENGIKY